MKKLNNFINKKNNKIILSFLIPLIIYTIIFYINGLLTNKTIILGDMRVQYYPLFNYLKEMLNGNNSIFYSFSKGLGGTMFGTIFYYLSSPLNILILFINKQQIPYFMTYLIILKLSLCGLTMYLYMKKKYKSNSTILLIFSLLYSFMGYNLNYFINIMWIDVVILAPLVLIGLENILEGKSPKIYIIVLFISIFSNYYISYMLCIFCILYFIYEVLLRYDIKKEKKQIKEITKKFIISSLLTGLLCSFFLVPCIFEMINYGRNINDLNIINFDFNFLNIFSKSYIGSLNLNDNLNYTSMNIYCSAIVLPLVYFYFCSKKIEKKEKILTLIFMLTMILPCFIGILNYAWHLFTIPSFYSYRYSFLLCLLLIRIAYKSYKTNIPKKTNIIIYLIFYTIISIYLIIITQYSKYYEFLNYKLICLTFFLSTLYMLILYKSPKNKDLIIEILLILECFINIFIIFNHSYFQETKIIDLKYTDIEKKYNNQRIEEEYFYNTSLIYNYNGINSFLSTSNHRPIDFLNKIGLYNKKTNNLYNNRYQSILVDDILGLKNLIIEEGDNFKHLKNKENNIYENDNAFSIGYIIKNECNNLEFEFLYDQKVFNCIFKESNEFYKEPEKIQETDDKIVYKVKENTPYYVYYNLDEELENNIFDENEKEILAIAHNSFIIKTENEKLEINAQNIDKEKLKIYYFDYETYNKKIEKINLEQLEYNINKNKLEGKINTNGGILMITIPYEKGYKIKIDNKEINYKEVLDTFIGIDINSGTHEVLIEYEQPGLKIGNIITLISLLTTLLYIRNEEKNETKI